MNATGQTAAAAVPADSKLILMSQNFTILLKFLSVSRSIRLIVSKWASSSEFCRNDVSVTQAIAKSSIDQDKKFQKNTRSDMKIQKYSSMQVKYFSILVF